MSPWSKQQPTRPTSSQKQSRPISPPKPARSVSPQKPTRPTTPSKPSRPTSSSKPNRPTSAKKPSRPTSLRKPNRPSPLYKEPNRHQHFVYIPQKSTYPSSPQNTFWTKRNSNKRADAIPESTNGNKVQKKKKSITYNDKPNVRRVSKPDTLSDTDDTHNFFGRIFKKKWKLGNNDVLVNRAQDLSNEGGISGNKKKYKNALKDKDTSKANRRRDTSQLNVSFSDLDNKVEKKNKFKRMLRRQVWRLSKGSIKGNKRLSTLLAENNINIDNIKPEEIDGSLINIEALGIQNKFLKRTVTWLLK